MKRVKQTIFALLLNSVDFGSVLNALFRSFANVLYGRTKRRGTPSTSTLTSTIHIIFTQIQQKFSKRRKPIYFITIIALKFFLQFFPFVYIHFVCFVFVSLLFVGFYCLFMRDVLQATASPLIESEWIREKERKRQSMLVNVKCALRNKTETDNVYYWLNLQIKTIENAPRRVMKLMRDNCSVKMPKRTHADEISNWPLPQIFIHFDLKEKIFSLWIKRSF